MSMMRHVLVAGVAMLLSGIFLPDPALPQGRQPSGAAVIRGTVRGTVSGQPLARARVCAELPDKRAAIWTRCAPVDSSAVFRLDRLPAGTWKVAVICGTVRAYSKSLVQESVAVSETAPVRRDWTVDPAGCDPRPLRRVSGEFRGYYAFGYEISDFVPCAADAWFVSADSVKSKPIDRRSAWAVLDESRFPEAFRWPNAPPDKYGQAHYYVHWRGTVVGPGHYGHFGSSAFELRVDSVLELRAVREGDCPSIRELRQRLKSSTSLHPCVRNTPIRTADPGTSSSRADTRSSPHQNLPRDIRITRAIGEVKKAIRNCSHDIIVRLAPTAPRLIGG